MRRLLLISLTVLFSFFGVVDSVTAQLPDGSIAPDFVIWDIDGNQHHLYSYLDDGKSVILFFIATWSWFDWSYHSSGTLQSVYNDYGPNGSDQIVVLLLSADNNTSLDDLYGNGNQSTGNFVEGTPFPIIDNAGGIFFGQYDGAYYPTIFTICPDYSLVESGQVDYDTHVSMALDGCGYYVVGCTDPNACNYVPGALVDDNSCDYCFCGVGTTWSASMSQCISSSEACGEGTIWDDVSQTCIIDELFCGWQPDGDGDMLIGVSDLLMLLAVFGDTDLDQDGIFDSADDCVGAYDECGVCNGDGPSIPVIESIEVLYDSVYAEAIDEWWVFEVGADTTYTLLCELQGCTDPTAENFNEEATNDDGSCIYPWACGDPVSYHGYDYQTVLIGEQCWFAENLRTEYYQNGESIPFLESGWNQLSTPAFTSYNNNSDLSATYGYLYNWFAVAGSNICPLDWRVSTQEDFNILHDELGGTEIAGGHMKAVGFEFWQEPNEGATNSSGLTALPGGWLNGGSDEFFHLGMTARWWTSSEYSTILGVGHRLWHDQENASFPGVDKKDGYSVRCVKD